ncbi:YtcA family lipoprotein [Dyella sp. A6]|uniref:YtcA family lipoprotein n=1 Tax=Dyella aluminiiresistens TaxID=3069105 RepID=UPI002E7A1065|nr:YtcA family lipoprotein [Dyella sp. A6]
MLEHPRPRKLHVSAVAMAVLLLSSCSAAPSRNILGSYFPSWMLCAVFGIAGVAAIRFVLVRTGIDAALPLPVLVYLSLWIAVTLGLWLVWLA